MNTFTRRRVAQAPRSSLQNNRRSSLQSAFTLIELLVVIAIIAILASILFPVFGRARENARRTACSSNMKQIGLAFMQYAQDYDERFPEARDYSVGGGPTPPAKTWDALIEPYAQKSGSGTYGQGSNAYLVCPSDTVTRTATAGYSNAKRSYGAITTDGLFAGWGDDYTWKRTDTTSIPGTAYNPGRALAEFPAVATTLMLVENPHENNRIGQNTNVSVSFPSNNGAVSNFAQDGSAQVNTRGPIHFDGWNYLFVDGHVKWLKPAATLGTRPASGVNANGFACQATLPRPCGMWTLADGD